MTGGMYFQQTRGEVAAFLPERLGRVLEVGCAEGRFSGELRHAEERWGIEPSPEAARSAAQRLDRVLTGSFEEASAHLPSAHFDVVVLNDVIEHMPGHDAFLEEIKRYVRPGGCLVGSIPNVRYVYNLYEVCVRKDWRYRDEGILDRTHVRFFTQKSFRRLLEEHGYRIEAMRGINSALSRPTTARMWFRAAIIAGAIGLSLGTQRDTRFLQFGFRARLDGDDPQRSGSPRATHAAAARN